MNGYANIMNEIETLITLKYFPIQYAEEYFTALPGDVLEKWTNNYKPNGCADICRGVGECFRRMTGSAQNWPNNEGLRAKQLKKELLKYYRKNP